MEGLIPFVIDSIKRRRDRSSYLCLSRGTRSLSMDRLTEHEGEGEGEAEAPASKFGQASSYRRSRSERRSPSDHRIGPSRSEGDVYLRQADQNRPLRLASNAIQDWTIRVTKFAV
ncbi:hypothetical protein MUK42_36056 [Musa troglodytarum]|uniref:Uncharacterized protein n=1 Tax=Musa troglodytarum TaxID=320322 RepID=A0A9E7F7F9_9LILI|nr:hypothetical protein MUK42_36056 [Musa troglodytarum]